jgi:hypothetical protein
MAMIEKEAAIKVYNETLGAKGAKGKLVRIWSDGYYEATLEISGRNYTALLPIASTVVLAAEPEPEIETLPEVER